MSLFDSFTGIKSFGKHEKQPAHIKLNPPTYCQINHYRQMHLLTPSLPSPPETIALDEVLLCLSENGQGGESLFFWESRDIFVVVGYANKVATEVNVTACEKKGIPILRRCSGGGTLVHVSGGLTDGLS